ILSLIPHQDSVGKLIYSGVSYYPHLGASNSDIIWGSYSILPDSTSVSIPEQTGILIHKQRLKVYPMPINDGRFTIQYDRGEVFEPYTITLIDGQGKEVMRKLISTPKAVIETTLPKGVYLLQAVVEGDKREYQYLVIE